MPRAPCRKTHTAIGLCCSCVSTCAEKQGAPGGLFVGFGVALGGAEGLERQLRGATLVTCTL
eukprot:347075-Chlamydomonas_euryale.AAC.6